MGNLIENNIFLLKNSLQVKILLFIKKLLRQVKYIDKLTSNTQAFILLSNMTSKPSISKQADPTL